MNLLKILESKDRESEKYIYQENERFYSTVYFYDKIDNSINSCCSSQIGCPESCQFCATGDYKFIRNLTVNELKRQFESSLDCLKSISYVNNPKLLYIIMEGMGEPTFNFSNISNALSMAIPALRSKFEKIVFRISTAGNIKSIPSYKRLVMSNKLAVIEHQFQVSLHSSLESDRQILIPGFGSRYSVEQTIDEFYKLSLWLGIRLKINYLLLNYNDRNNYTKTHLNRLIQLLNDKNTRVKLTSYSETGKTFSSPNSEKIQEIVNYLQANGIETKYRKLVGDDIFAACGMLHYQ